MRCVLKVKKSTTLPLQPDSVFQTTRQQCEPAKSNSNVVVKKESKSFTMVIMDILSLLFSKFNKIM